MKISSTSYQPTILKAVKYEKAAELTIKEQPEAKQVLREMVQRRIAEIEEAQTDMGEDDPKAQLIIEKFKSGKKLTDEEMNYIRKHAPGMVDYIQRIMREREIVELGMKLAPTKTDVHMIALQASKQIEKYPNPEEREIRAKHLANAIHEYEKTDEYKNKPNHIFDEKTIEKQKQANTKHYSTKVMIQAYDQHKN